MKAKTLILTFLAIGCGLLATTGVRRYLNTQRAAQASQTTEETATIVLARRDIPLATMVAKDMLQEASWPKHILPRGAVVELDRIVGRATRCPIFAGEPIVRTKLADEGAQQGLAAVIPKGMRAIAVKVNEFSGVAGFLQPEAIVDVLVVVPRRSETNVTMCRTIIQEVRVLAVDQKMTRGDKESQIVDAVTLLVTPQQAEHLSLAGNQGKLHLIMRNNTDKEASKTPGVSLATLVSGKRRPEATDSAVKKLLERIRQGTGRAGRDGPSRVASKPQPSAPKPVAKGRVIQEIRGTAVSFHTIGVPSSAAAGCAPGAVGPAGRVAQ